LNTVIRNSKVKDTEDKWRRYFQWTDGGGRIQYGGLSTADFSII